MTIKKTGILAPVLLLGVCAMAEEATGPTVTFTGYLDEDMAATYNKDTKELEYQANHEADFVANVAFSEKTTISLGITSYTSKSVPSGGTPVIDEEGNQTRWPSMAFDGIWGSYATDMGLTLLAGDFCVTGGTFSYYGYKRTLFYGSVFKENYFRGLGFDFKGISLYAGSSDTANNTTAAYFAYLFENGMISLKPFAFGTSNFDGVWNVKAGLDAQITLGDNVITATYGIIKDDDMDPSHTIKAEASLVFGSFTLAATGFYAIIPDDDASVVDVPDESFFYVEPGYTINDVISTGMPLELHTREKGVEDTDFSVYPTLYVNPTGGSQIVVWAGPTFFVDDSDADPVFSFGTELIASF
ncbi:MAG TPA: hypothetical protein VLM37_02245 [Fibrobacteraceae bacterium]|nr:hypothetical protein [Fibrobacteraceae bacterium]